MENSHNKTKLKNMNRLYFNILNHEKGFALVMLLIMIPIILTAYTLFYIGCAQIEISSALNQMCRAELQKSLLTSQKWLQTFIKLNARIVQIKPKMNINELKSHLLDDLPKEYLSNQLLNQIQSLTNTYDIVELLQQSLLNDYLVNKEKSLIMHKYTVEKQLHLFSDQLKRLLQVSKIEVQIHFMKVLPVAPTLNSNLSSFKYYTLKPQLETIEKQTLSWSYQLTTSTPMSEWTPWSQRIRGECTKTLTKEAPWIPVLIVDKFS